MILKVFSRAACVLGLMSIVACGTTYTLPKVSENSNTEASRMFAQAQADNKVGGSSQRAAQARFQRVVARVRPVAESFCKSQAAAKPEKVCELPIYVDTEMPVENAYQTRDDQDNPLIAFSVPMLLSINTDDELAFILSHEYGHHIADHIEKGRQQAMAGAILMGALTATSQAYASQANPYRYTGADSAELQRNMEMGASAGQKAYSQTYELESDVIATHITRAAGYDPVEGAKFFARPAPARTTAGNLSFWGTHPPNSVRLATVIEAQKSAEAGQGLVRKQK